MSVEVVLDTTINLKDKDVKDSLKKTFKGKKVEVVANKLRKKRKK